MPFFCNKRLADFAPVFCADRNILQVRIAGRQSPRRCSRHGIGCMHTPRIGIDLFLQGVCVGGFQLR